MFLKMDLLITLEKWSLKVSPCCPKKTQHSFFGGSNKITFRQPMLVASKPFRNLGQLSSRQTKSYPRRLGMLPGFLARWTNVRRLFQTFLLLHFLADFACLSSNVVQQRELSKAVTRMQGAQHLTKYTCCTSTRKYPLHVTRNVGILQCWLCWLFDAPFRQVQVRQWSKHGLNIAQGDFGHSQKTQREMHG